MGYDMIKKLLVPFAALLCLLLIPLAAQAEGLSLSMDGQPVAESLTVDITAHPTFQMTASEPVSWSSSAPARLQVDENGLCTPARSGEVTLTATALSGEKASVRIRQLRGVGEIRLTGERELTAGQSVRFEAEVLPGNATEDGLAWSSSDPSVARVNRYGTVMAQRVEKAGTAIITARAKDGLGAFAQFEVTVRPAARKITLYLDDQPVSGQTLSLDLGAEDRTLSLRAVVEPADAAQTVLWSSSAKGRATVKDGLVTGLKNGSVTLTATSAADRRVKTSCRLSLSTLVNQIDLTAPSELTAGASAKASARALPESASNRKVRWTSSDPSALTVNAYGGLRAHSVSERRQVTLTATAADGSGTVGSRVVTVCPAPQSVELLLDGQAVNGQTFALDLAGEGRLLLLARVLPEQAAQTITWTSSNKNVASVSDGLVIGRRRGTVTLTAVSADKKVRATCRVTVSTLAKSVQISGPDGVSSGRSIRLSASVQPAGAAVKKVVWSCDNANALRVNASGTATGLDVPAITTVTVRAAAADGSGVYGTHRVTVYPRPQAVQLSMNGSSLPNILFLDTAAAGTARTVSASIYPADAAQGVTWSTSNARVARVDSSGVVTCVGAGSAVITVRSAADRKVSREFRVVCDSFNEMPYYLEVDKANQVVRVYERGDGSYTKLIRRMICSSGAAGTHFENGMYRMHGARYHWCSAGHDSIYMQYATRIRGSYMFHGVPTIGAAGNRVKNSWYQKLGHRDSGGCIRLLAADAKWIYENVPSGAVVLVLQGVRAESEYGAVSAPASRQTGAFIWDPTDDNPDNPYYDSTYSSLVR